MNWNTAVIVILGSVSCSILCQADARYYRTGRRYGGYSTPQSNINKYNQYNSYGSSEKYSHGKSNHHHPYYMSKIRYTGKSEPVQVNTSRRFGMPIQAKQGRITKKPQVPRVKPTPASPALQPRSRPVQQPARPVQQTARPVEQRTRPVQKPQTRNKPVKQTQQRSDDIQTNLINTEVLQQAAPVVQQRVLAPIPAVPDRPVQPAGRQAVVPPRIQVPANSNESILPNMILEAIPAVPNL
jgi:hypothetical protein